jgi:hypothetical protein
MLSSKNGIRPAFIRKVTYCLPSSGKWHTACHHPESAILPAIIRKVPYRPAIIRKVAYRLPLSRKCHTACHYPETVTPPAISRKVPYRLPSSGKCHTACHPLAGLNCTRARFPELVSDYPYCNYPTDDLTHCQQYGMNFLNLVQCSRLDIWDTFNMRWLRFGLEFIVGKN